MTRPVPASAVVAHGHRKSARRARMALVVLIVLFAAVVVLNAGIGAVSISPQQVGALLLQPLGITLDVPIEEQQATIFWAIRLPRIVFGALVGGALATAGAGLQGVFRNPLADPSLVGISASAAFAASLMFVLGGSWMQHDGLLQMFSVPAAAFIGALLTTLLLLRVSRVGGKTVVTTMLLCGIAITAFGFGGTGALTYMATDSQLRSITFWQLGSLGSATWSTVAVAAPFLLGAIFILPRFARTLNLILLGDSEAKHLGVAIDSVRMGIFALAALGVATAVAFAGAIGFVGLVVPHLLRLTLGPDNRYVVGLSPLMGATLLLGADLISRTIVAPAELPIGIVTAAIGAPFFFWLVVRQRAEGVSL